MRYLEAAQSHSRLCGVEYAAMWRLLVLSHCKLSSYHHAYVVKGITLYPVAMRDYATSFHPRSTSCLHGQMYFGVEEHFEIIWAMSKLVVCYSMYRQRCNYCMECIILLLNMLAGFRPSSFTASEAIM